MQFLLSLSRVAVIGMCSAYLTARYDVRLDGIIIMALTCGWYGISTVIGYIIEKG